MYPHFTIRLVCPYCGHIVSYFIVLETLKEMLHFFKYCNVLLEALCCGSGSSILCLKCNFNDQGSYTTNWLIPCNPGNRILKRKFSVERKFLDGKDFEIHRSFEIRCLHPPPDGKNGNKSAYWVMALQKQFHSIVLVSNDFN